jgi:hypothetical protein
MTPITKAGDSSEGDKTEVGLFLPMKFSIGAALSLDDLDPHDRDSVLAD